MWGFMASVEEMALSIIVSRAKIWSSCSFKAVGIPHLASYVSFINSIMYVGFYESAEEMDLSIIVS